MILFKKPSCADTVLPFAVWMLCRLTRLHVSFPQKHHLIWDSQRVLNLFSPACRFTCPRDQTVLFRLSRAEQPLCSPRAVWARVECGFPYFLRKQIGCQPRQHYNSLLLKNDSFMEALLPPSCRHSPWRLQIMPSITYFFKINWEKISWYIVSFLKGAPESPPFITELGFTDTFNCISSF